MTSSLRSSVCAAVATLAAILTVSCSSPSLSRLPPATAPVWKISSGAHAIYLGGTVHLLRPQDLPPPAEFDVAFAAADEVVFETDVARLQSPETLGFLMRQGVYPDGETLRNALTPEAWTAVEQYCATAGLSLAMMEKFKPWMFVMNVTVLELQRIGVGEEGIDFIYARRAAEAGKPTGGLESYEQHLTYLTNLAEGHPSEMILATLQELGRMRAMMEEALSAWRSGDLKRIDALLVEPMRTSSPGVYQQLVVERNRLWLPQLEEMLASDPVELVLVGAGHLPGENGLLASLLERGYEIEPVIATLPDPVETTAGS